MFGRDKFVGKVEFKDTLRRDAEQKRPERDKTRRGRHYSEAGYLVADRGRGRDLGSREGSREGPREGGRDGRYLIESDFDFRSPPSTRDNSRDRKPRLDLDRSLRRPQDPGHSARRTEDVYASPRRGPDDIYASPRRGQEEVYAPPRRKELRIAVDQIKRPSQEYRGIAR